MYVGEEASLTKVIRAKLLETCKMSLPPLGAHLTQARCAVGQCGYL